MRSEYNTRGAHHFDPVFSYRTGWGDIVVYGYRGEGYMLLDATLQPRVENKYAASGKTSHFRKCHTLVNSHADAFLVPSAKAAHIMPLGVKVRSLRDLVRYLLVSAENDYEFRHHEPINPFEELLQDEEELKRLQDAVGKYVGEWMR